MIIEISTDDLLVELAPHIGGAITTFRWRGSRGEFDLLRPATIAAIANGDFRGMSCFAMIPFASLIDHACFEFRRRRYELNRNFPGRDIALHGDAWQNAWEVEQHEADFVRLRYKSTPDRYPFAYRAETVTRLTSRGLYISICLTNVDKQPMPAGCGFHPYFPRHGGATVNFRATQLWQRDARGIPLGRVPLPAQLDFTAERSVPDIPLNDFFDGWDGQATISWPDDDIEVCLHASPIFGRLLFFAPAR